MKDNHDIDDLLNSFIDGQLGQREQVEVQRLIAHDPVIAKRLHDLRKYSDLVSALPFEEAPAGISNDVKTALERKTLLGARLSHMEERKGAVQLFMRKFVAAAAMFLLVVALGAVVYTVISPADSKIKKAAFNFERQSPQKNIVIKKAETNIVRQAPVAKKEFVVVAEPQPADFNGKIELMAKDIAAFDAYINRAFENNTILPQTSPLTENRKLYSITCSPENFKSFLSELKNIWSKFDSTRLSIDDSAVAVDDVTIEQLSKIAEQTTINAQIQTAKNFAAVNKINQNLPGNEVMIAVNEKQQNLSNIPKPVLASKEKPAGKKSENASGKKIHLNILIIPSK